MTTSFALMILSFIKYSISTLVYEHSDCYFLQNVRCVGEIGNSTFQRNNFSGSKIVDDFWEPYSDVVVPSKVRKDEKSSVVSSTNFLTAY
jgi:hypothetical protein